MHAFLAELPLRRHFDKFTSWKRKWGVGLGCMFQVISLNNLVNIRFLGKANLALVAVTNDIDVEKPLQFSQIAHLIPLHQLHLDILKFFPVFPSSQQDDIIYIKEYNNTRRC